MRSSINIITMVDPRHGSERVASGEIENINHPYRVAHVHICSGSSGSGVTFIYIII